MRPGLARSSSALTGAGFWRKATNAAVPTTILLMLPRTDRRAGSSAKSCVWIFDRVMVGWWEKELTLMNRDRSSAKSRIAGFIVLL